jgi:hypothetical protein
MTLTPTKNTELKFGHLQRTAWKMRNVSSGDARRDSPFVRRSATLRYSWRVRNQPNAAAHAREYTFCRQQQHRWRVETHETRRCTLLRAANECRVLTSSEIVATFSQVRQC